jgi:alanine dehydrogenase
LAALDSQFTGRVQTIYATSAALEKYSMDADLVIGAVLITGAAAPKLLTRTMVSRMKKGTVIVDVAIDQGGCVETARPTTHSDPIFVVDGVVHYCVANMPGAVARTSTFALNNATLPYVMTLANKGWKKALSDDAHFRNGLNVAHGKITHASVAEALHREFVNPLSVLAS